MRSEAEVREMHRRYSNMLSLAYLELVSNNVSSSKHELAISEVGRYRRSLRMLNWVLDEELPNVTFDEMLLIQQQLGDEDGRQVEQSEYADGESGATERSGGSGSRGGEASDRASAKSATDGAEHADTTSATPD